MKVAVLALLAACCALGQPRAQFSGFVRDTSSAVVQQAAISVLNLDTGIRRSTVSNQEGFYAVSSLTPGQYKITVRKPGFATVAQTGIGLHSMDVGRLDFTLEVGSLRDEITVDSRPTLMNASDGSSGMVTTRNPAEQLPVNGRGLQGLIDLAPGVLTTPATAGEAGQFSVNGQRPATNYFTVDGVSANNGVSGSGLPGQFSGSALPSMSAIGSLHNLLSLGELDELRVQTSTYAPEYGRLPGAQVAVSTRSGSNELHGEVFSSLRNEAIAAGNWFGNAAGLGRIPQRMVDSGGSLSGPVLRNRTFFLVSTEQIRLRQPGVVRIPVPSLAARDTAPAFPRDLVRSFPLPNGPGLGGGAALHTAVTSNPAEVGTTGVRVDQALGSVGTLFVRINHAPSSNQFGYLQRNEAHFRSQSLTVGVITAISPRVTNDFRFGNSRTRVESSWLPGAANIDLRRVLPSPGQNQKLYAIGIRGFGQILTGDAGESRQGLWSLANTLSFAAGRHDVRAGLDYQRMTPERDRAIESLVQLYDSFERLMQGATPTYTFAQTGGGRSLIETMSFFAQDTWHVTPRLNLTYGVRWEFTPAPSYRNTTGPEPPGVVTLPTPGGSVSNFASGGTPVWKTRYSQFAPRLGAAWRLGNATVIRAGAGLFYDLGFSSAVDLINGAPFNRWRSATGIATVATESLQYGFAPNLKLPYTAQWNVTVERGLSANSAVSVGYVGSSGKRLMRREGELLPGQITPGTVLATNNGKSSYHALQVHYRSRDVRGLQGTVSWTWAHAIDNGSWDSAAYLVFAGSGRENDRASANFDVRQSLQGALSYDLGRSKLPWSRGWLLSGTLRARSGFPVDLVTTDQPFGLGFDNDVRPDLVPGVPVWLADTATPGGRRLNPAAFRIPRRGQQGTLGRNALRGNGLVQTDMALQRTVVVTERLRLQFRAEAYNVANSPSFADPMRVLASPLFGTSPSMMNQMLGAGRPSSGLSPAFQSGGARVFQAGFTLRF